MKRRDIFHGACQAAQDINKCPDLMLEVEVALVSVLAPDCDPVKGIDQLLKALVDPSMNVIGVTGMFCDRLAEVYSPVLSQWARSFSNLRRIICYEGRQSPVRTTHCAIA